MPNETVSAKLQLRALSDRLCGWLVNDAYPLWSTRGVDPRSGGFIEALDRGGQPSQDARRARVQARQVYSFAQAPKFEWQGDWAGIVERGIEFFAAHYRRSDGLFRMLVDAQHVVLDERATLYDQSFALLGFASAAGALSAVPRFEPQALALLNAIEQKLGAPHGGYYADETRSAKWEPNPHMHLLEACVAWAEIGADPRWAVSVRQLVDLAHTRFIRRDSGALGESYSFTGEPTADLAGRIIEPGHQFEWAWLLVRCEPHLEASARQSAFRLIHIGESYGVHQGVAINALLDDFSVSDDHARFWPQTERLKAALTAAELTGESHYWSMALSAAESFFPYLKTETAGQWYDVQRPTGELIAAVAPASSFYHLVGALLVLKETMQRV